MKMKKVTLISSLTLTGILLLGFQNCAKTTSFSDNGMGTVSTTLSSTAYNHATPFKVSEVTNPNVDILFVIDNSGSMSEEQQKISQVFSGFIAQVSQLNWRIAITTTDAITADKPCLKGNLCIMTGTDQAPGYFIDAQTPDVNNVFMNKIRVGIGGSGNEIGLSTAKTFLTNKKADYQSFMRTDSNFVIIFVTDSEETSTLTSADFLKSAKALLPAGKKFTAHASIVLPGDAACKLINSAENKFAQKYFDVVKATDGIAASICDAHYASQFKLIADVTVGKVAQVNLDCAVTDQDGDKKLDVSIISDKGEVLNSDSYEVSDSKITFTPALENVGNYKVSYSCVK